MVVCTTVVSTRKIKVGEYVEVNGVDILYANPNPCIFDNSSMYRLAKIPSVKTEKIGQNDVLMIIGDSKRVYLNEKIYNMFMEKLETFRKTNTLGGGLLLYGVPGSGKSMLADISAQLLGLDMMTVSPNDILSKYVGDSEKNMVKVFEQIKAKAPIVVLFDEVDWLAKRRDMYGDSSGSSIAQSNIFNIFLQYFQKYIINEKVPAFVVGTTNMPLDSLDPAFLRRFPHRIFFAPPSTDVIRRILDDYQVKEYKVRGEVMDKEEFINYVVSTGMSIAEIISLIETNGQLNVGETTSTTFGRRIKRVVPRRVSKEIVDLNILNPTKPLMCENLNKLKLLVTGKPFVARALVAMQIVVMCNKQIFEPLLDYSMSPVEIEDSLRQYDAVGLITVLTPSMKYAEVLENLLKNDNISVIIIAPDVTAVQQVIPGITSLPHINLANLETTVVNQWNERNKLIKEVCDFYGIKYSNEMKELNIAKEKGELLRLLENYVLMKNSIS